jgi:vancomycin permeability regulator SanA
MVKKVFLVLTVVILLFATYIISYGHINRVSKVDVCVVLGSKVNKDGSVSKCLKARLDKSIELYRQNFFDKVIVSGGLGKEGYKEAEIMSMYLVKSGIDQQNIIIDNDGVNTFKTAEFTSNYIKYNGYSSVMIVSQYFHILRTKMIFDKLGIKNIYKASPRYYQFRDLYSIPREMVAIVKYLLM